MAATPASCRGFAHPLAFFVRASVPSPVAATARCFPAHARRCLGTSPAWLAKKPNNPTAAAAAAARTKNLPDEPTRRPPPAAKAPEMRPAARRAAAAVAAPRREQAAAAATAAAATSALHSRGYAASLAAKPNPTVLYEGSPQKSLIVFSYSSGLFLNSAAALNIWLNVYNVPEGFPPVATYAFAGAAVMLSIVGTKFALTPASVVRSITVLPNNNNNSKKKDAAAAPAAAPGEAADPVRIEVRARGLFPGLPLKRAVVSPGDLVLHTRLQPPRAAPETASERAAREQREREEAAARRQYELDHLMTAPFRHAAWAARTIFEGARRSLTGEGFAHIEVGGKVYKLDVTSAYALEDGRALDRIARIKADEPGA